MNAFAGLSQTLSEHTLPEAVKLDRVKSVETRALLKALTQYEADNGPVGATPQQLGLAAGVKALKVYNLLRTSIRNEMVFYKDGLYTLNAKFESASARQIRSAIKLLTSNGYSVAMEKPQRSSSTSPQAST